VGQRVTIALMAKGSMNNLHRRDVVDALHARGLEVEFLLLDGQPPPRQPFADCRYLACRLVPETGALGYWRALFRYFRSLYANDLVPSQTRAQKRGPLRRIVFGALILLARSRLVMRLTLLVEGCLYRRDTIEGLVPARLDLLLLQTVGGRDSEHGAVLTRWANRHGVPVVHLAGNYDHLPTKGYRGVAVERLLVWSPVMRDDAIRLHGIAPERIRVIGSVRYDALAREIVHDRATFLRAIGLDPGKRTILFAGPQSEYPYFEMLQAFEQIQAEDGDYQLILRLYPDKALMASPYVKPLLHYARATPGIYLSIGDPQHGARGARPGPPEIEQTELWHALRHCDVVVNYFSTIAVEACLFDKPAVYFVYRQLHSHGWLSPPPAFDYGTLLHNRRMLAYGVVPVARNRAELLRLIREAVADPARFRAERALIVRQELGPLDGHVRDRLAEACVEALAAHRPGDLRTLASAPGPGPGR
jgi:hypothetical protein